MSCSADYYLVTCSQRQLVCADVCSARTSRRYQNRKFTFAVWNSRCCELVAPLVRAEHTSAQTIMTVTHSKRRIVGAANVGRMDVITHDKLF
jgi:hypothetical protein